ncbi:MULTISPECIES: SDR family NAD(P)-dependent oxidoreductase [Burkholderia]|uniref:SDR family NAD(P)-dependent oxidoreductase n=1 Tax=Burkholderia TaxID=32008 RepID=UPI0023DD9B38|nr:MULTISPECIES: SDR family oxidoreductase [Burkholderia cepacia complex]MDF3100085.1 SDR family oxidoreductase [Burkholderia semiarida]MDF3104532.1 SDR family oxidoreductase [Burkholderia semiarida]MDN7485580.1 SDR family oxidoreductase [Burkholderia orbicola]
MADDLDGKVVIVTGATSGIGFATALAFAEKGARLILSGRASVDPIVTQCRMQGAEAFGLSGDLANEELSRNLVEEAMSRFGTVNILINNAGFGTSGGVETVEESQLRAVWDVNFLAAFRMSRLVIPLIRQHGGGAILFTTALAGMYGMANALAYSTSKAAVINLCKAMAMEVSRDGITCNCVSPGPVDTPMLQEAIDAYGISREEFRASSPTGRIATAQDVANALLFLSSGAARSINGHVLVVDNGMYAGMFTPRLI